MQKPIDLEEAEARNPKYAVEKWSCICGEKIMVHVRLSDKTPVGQGRICPLCKGTEENGKLFWEKAYAANAQGRIIE